MSFDTPFSRGQRPRPWHAPLILCAMSMLQFFIAVDVTVVNVALPSIGADLGVGGHSLTWVVVGYTLTGGGLLMLGGRLGDVFGRRRTLLGGTTIFGAASLLAGLAPSFPLLVVARLLQGAGEAIALPAAMATIVLLYPEGPRRSRALSIWAAVASCGLVLGFALSGIITEYLGWRWIFLIATPFILVVIAATWLLIPGERRAPTTRVSIDVPGALLLTASPLLFIYAVVGAGDPETSIWLNVLALIGALLSGVAFLRIESRAVNPIVPRAIFANKARLKANLTTMLLSGALSTSFLLFTFYLQDRLRLSPMAAGVTMLPLAGALIAATVLVPRLMTRWGARACVLTGIASTGSAMTVIAVVAVVGGGVPWLLLAMLLIAAGMGFGLVGLQYLAVSGTTDADAGVASGIQRAADQLGGASGVAVFVGLGFAPALHHADAFLVSAALALVGLFAAAVIMLRQPGGVGPKPKAH